MRKMLTVLAATVVLLLMVAGRSKPAMTPEQSQERAKRLISLYPVALLILERCPGYELGLQMQLLTPIVNGMNKEGKTLLLAFAAAADLKYEYKRGATQFCRRILADHGPGSAEPLVK